MADPYVGEIRTVGFNFAPTGWALCDGQLLPISQNTALFSLLGTYYGGDGRTTFALPDLNGATAIGQGQGQGLSDRFLGEAGGETAVTLLTSEMPVHSHQVKAVAAAGTTGDAANGAWAQPRYGRVTRNAFAASANTELRGDAFAPTGGSQPHNNLPPSLTLNFIIALQGVFPPRS